MAHLILKRGGGWRDALRRYTILIDDVPRATLRATAAAHVELPAGVFVLRVAIDGHGSAPLDLFLSDGCATVVSCTPGAATTEEMRRGSAARTYLSLAIADRAEMCRAFLRQAWRVAAFQIAERGAPGPLGTLGVTRGEVGVLYRGCRIPGVGVATHRGSANHRLWSHLTALGWLTEVDPERPMPRGYRPADTLVRPGLVEYAVTDLGRVELLDILA